MGTGTGRPVGTGDAKPLPKTGWSWSVDDTFELWKDPAERARYKGTATFLPTELVPGVTAAVGSLNNGSIEAPTAGFCIAYSATSATYFCLYGNHNGKSFRKKALAEFGLAD